MDLRKVQVRVANSRTVFNSGIESSPNVLPPQYETGYFHCWEDYKDDDFGGIYAIVEMEDGRVEKYDVDQIKFIDKPIQG